METRASPPPFDEATRRNWRAGFPAGRSAASSSSDFTALFPSRGSRSASTVDRFRAPSGIRPSVIASRQRPVRRLRLASVKNLWPEEKASGTMADDSSRSSATAPATPSVPSAEMARSRGLNLADLTGSSSRMATTSIPALLASGSVHARISDFGSWTMTEVGIPWALRSIAAATLIARDLLVLPAPLPALMRQWTAGTIAIPPPMQPAATSPSAAAFPSQRGQRLATLDGLDSSQASPCVRVGARSPANVPSWSLAHERAQETNPSARTEAATRESAASSSPAWPDAAASAAASRGPWKT